ncbi:BTAD domain-containing putative transcriptional regulator [Streptomyces niveus]
MCTRPGYGSSPHPIRERLVGHLTTALSRLGWQAEALELYERTRRHLVEEFGVDTAVELQRVHTAILRQEPGIGGRADRSPDEPVDGPTDRTFPTEVATSDGAPKPERSNPFPGSPRPGTPGPPPHPQPLPSPLPRPSSAEARSCAD